MSAKQTTETSCRSLGPVKASTQTGTLLRRYSRFGAKFIRVTECETHVLSTEVGCILDGTLQWFNSLDLEWKLAGVETTKLSKPQKQPRKVLSTLPGPSEAVAESPSSQPSRPVLDWAESVEQDENSKIAKFSNMSVKAFGKLPIGTSTALKESYAKHKGSSPSTCSKNSRKISSPSEKTKSSKEPAPRAINLEARAKARFGKDLKDLDQSNPRVKSILDLTQRDFRDYVKNQVQDEGSNTSSRSTQGVSQTSEGGIQVPIPTQTPEDPLRGLRLPGKAAEEGSRC